MKKILFALLISLCFISGVNAEITFPLDGMGISNSCSRNLIKTSITNHIYSNRKFNISTSTNSTYPINDYFVELEPGTNYSISNDSSLMCYFYFFDSEFNLITSYTGKKSSFTTPDGAVYFNVGAYTTFSKISTVKFQLEFGDTATDYVDYEECSVTPEPDIPGGDIEEDEPTIIPDTTLTDFYHIFTTKLKDFCQYASENKFLLSAIAIIILIIILELILNLFSKGGYH